MIEIECVARPRPAAHSNARGIRRVVESGTAFPKHIPEQRIAHRVFLIEGSHFLGRAFFEDFLHRDAFAGRGPHIADVEILRAVVVVVEPGNAHPRADVFDRRLRSNVREGSVAIVAVEILSAKIIDHVEIGPAVAIVVAPSAAEAVARVVLVQAGLCGDVAERAVALVAHQKVGRAVLRIVIRRGIFVLPGALIVGVEAEVDVEPAVAVIVGSGRAGEGSLRRIRELERVGPLAKLASAFVQE